MKCIECAHLDLKTFRDHAKVGYGRCKLEPLPGVFVSISIERECKTFSLADAEIVEKRKAWQAGRK